MLMPFSAHVVRGFKRLRRLKRLKREDVLLSEKTSKAALCPGVY